MTPRKPTVLIVDDAEMARRELRLHLQDKFEVVGDVADGVQAVQACRELSPELVVMDAAMPKMSGIEAARAITLEPNPPVVVIVSGLKDESVVLQAFEAGASDYLFKPVDGEALCRALLSYVKNEEAA